MSTPFDPYHSWLGIRPEEQPPNHYRLLGIQPFEDNADAIENAADQRMSHLRTFQTGKRAEHSQKLLNQVAAAKLCLLNPEKKADYDRQLRKELKAKEPESEPAETSEPAESAGPRWDRQVAPSPPLSAPNIDVSVVRSSAKSKSAGEKRLPANLALILGAAGVGLLILVGVILWASTLGGDGTPGEVAGASGIGSSANPPPPPSPPPEPDRRVADARPKNPPTGSGGFDWTRGAGKPPAKKPAPFVPAPSKPPWEPIVEAPKPVVKDVAPGGPPPATAAQSPAPSPGKHPVPAPAVQDEAFKKLDEFYKFAEATTSPKRLELARKLLEMAEASRGNPDERYAVLRKAMELACDGGDAQMMLDVVDSIAADYALDSLTGKANMLAKFTAGATDAQRIEQVVRASLRVIDQGLAEGRIDLAMNAAELAHEASRRSAGKDFRKETFDRREKLKDDFDEWQKIRQAENRLAADPADPDANLALGRWHCFRKGDWQRGLPCLAKGSDPVLKVPASQEAAGPIGEPTAQLKLAEAWWNVAQSLEGREKLAVLKHARHWYEYAQPWLPGGLDKAKAEMRLKEIAQAVPGGQPTVSADAPSSGKPSSKPPVKPLLKPSGKPKSKRKYLPPLMVAQVFRLTPPKWGIVGDEIQGEVTDIKQPENNPFAQKEFRTGSIELGLKMNAKWFQAIHIYVDDKRYSYVRGALNLGTLIQVEGEKENFRLGEKVESVDGWSSLAVTLKDDTVGFYYNDTLEWSRKIPEVEGGKHKVGVGFGSNSEPFKKTIIGVKDFYIEEKP